MQFPLRANFFQGNASRSRRVSWARKIPPRTIHQGRQNQSLCDGPINHNIWLWKTVRHICGSFCSGFLTFTISEFALVVTSQKLVYGSWLLRSSLPLIYLLEKTRMGIPLPQRPNSMLLWQGMSKTYLFRAPVPVSKTKMLVPLVDRNRLNARFPRDSRKQQS